MIHHYPKTRKNGGGNVRSLQYSSRGGSMSGAFGLAGASEDPPVKQKEREEWRCRCLGQFLGCLQCCSDVTWIIEGEES